MRWRVSTTTVAQSDSGWPITGSLPGSHDGNGTVVVVVGGGAVVGGVASRSALADMPSAGAGWVASQVIHRPTPAPTTTAESASATSHPFMPPANLCVRPATRY